MGVFSPDDSRVLGGTGLHTRLGEGALEIGYWIAADSIGQGYATELSAVLTRVGFEHFGVDRIEIRVDPENARSEKVPQKLGFTHEATLRRRLPTKRGSDLRDVNVWTMFAAELASSPCLQYEYVAYDALGRRCLTTSDVARTAHVHIGRRHSGTLRVPLADRRTSCHAALGGASCAGRRRRR